MHLECHATLGWVLANVFAKNRPERNFVVLASVLPDIDALPYLFGPYYYGLYHHTFGHNIFLGIALALYGWRKYGPQTGLAGAASFASHIVTDAYLSNWQLYLLWPISRRGYLPDHSLDLASPVNTWLLYSVPIFVILVAAIWKRTPLEWIHPRLDSLFLSFFRSKAGSCAVCHSGANQICDQCAKSICPKHLNVSMGWRIRCPECRSASRK